MDQQLSHSTIDALCSIGYWLPPLPTTKSVTVWEHRENIHPYIEMSLLSDTSRRDQSIVSVPGDPELRTAKVPGNLSTFMSRSPDDTPGPPNLYILQVPTSFGVTGMRLSYQPTALRAWFAPYRTFLVPLLAGKVQRGRAVVVGCPHYCPMLQQQVGYVGMP